jgi:hypothetical protein
MDKSNWDRKVFDETKFSPEQLNLIFELLKNRKIYIFASSNCNECSLSLPYFFKLLTDSKISNEDINLFGLDDYWEEPTVIYKKFDLKEIPLIYITYNDNKINLTKTEFMNFDIIISKLQSQEK